MPLAQAGIQFVVQGAGALISDVQAVATALGSFASSATKTSGISSALGATWERLSREFTIFARALTYYAIYQVLQATEKLAVATIQLAINYDRLAVSEQALVARDLMRSGQAKDMTEALEKAIPVTKELLGWTERLAVASPYTTDDIAKSEQVLAVFGVSVDKVKQLTQDIVDFGSANGRTADQLYSIAHALGQVNTVGHLQGIQIRELTAAGVPIVQMLAEAYGKTTEEISKMVTKGLIPAQAVFDVFMNRVEKDYTGAAERFSHTIAGLTSSLEDIVTIDLREWGLGFLTALQPAMQVIVDMFYPTESLKKAVREFGESIGEHVSDILAFVLAIAQSDDPLRNLAYSIGKVIPGFGEFFDAIRSVGPELVSLAGDMLSFGFNIAISLASGIIQGASYVIEAVSYIASIITYLFKGGSPPKILPDLPKWGANIVESLLSGFRAADLSAISDLQRTMRSAFENLVPSGQMTEGGILAAVLGTTAGIQQAISDIKSLGYVTQETFAGIAASAGPAAKTVLELVKSYATWQEAATALSKAQQELNDVTKEYDDQLSALQGKLKASQEAATTAQEERDLAKWRKIASSDAYTERTKAKAQREIEQILLERQIRTVQGERDVAVKAAQDKVDAAQKTVDLAKEEFDTVQARIEFTRQQNALIEEQTKLTDGGTDSTDRAKEAEFQLALAKADTAGKIKLYQQRLSELKPGTAEYFETQTKIVELEQRLQQERLQAAEKAKRQHEQELKASQEILDAEFKLALAKADTAGQIELYKQKLAGLTPGTKDYLETQAQIQQLEERLAGERKRALEEATREQEQLRDAQLQADLAGKSHEERLKLLQARLAELTPGTVKYLQVLREIREEEAAIEREREAAAKKAAAGRKGKGAGGGGGPGDLDLGGGGGLAPPGGATGDFAKRVEEFKAKIEEFKKGFEDLKKAGEGLNTSLASLGGSIKDLITRFSELKEQLDKAGVSLSPFLPIVRDLGTAFSVIVAINIGKWLLGLAAGLGPIGLLIIGLGLLHTAWEGVDKSLFSNENAKKSVSWSETIQRGLEGLKTTWDHDIVLPWMEFDNWCNTVLTPTVRGFGKLLGEWVVDRFNDFQKGYETYIHTPLVEFEALITKNVMGALKEWYDFLTGPIAKVVADFAVWVTDNLIKPLMALVDELVGHSVLSAFKEVYDFVVGPILSAWKDFKEGVETNLIAPVNNFVSLLQGKVGEVLSAARDIGESVIDGIRSGVSSAFSGLKSWFEGKVQDLIEAGRRAIKGGSPSLLAAELIGEPIVDGILKGIQDNLPQLLASLGDASEDLVRQAMDIGERIRDAVTEGFNAKATTARLKVRNLQELLGLDVPSRSGIQEQLRQVEEFSKTIADPAQALKYFQLRSSQIFEVAKLQQDIDKETDATKKQQLQEQLALILQAQDAEQKALEAQRSGPQTAGVPGIINDLQKFLMNPELPGILENPFLNQLAFFLEQLRNSQVPPFLIGASPPPLAKWLTSVGEAAAYAGDMLSAAFRPAATMENSTVYSRMVSTINSGNITNAPVYNYSPHYGSTPKNPRQDFQIMKSWGV